MKKLIFSLTILIITLFTIGNCYSENTAKLFLDGKVFELKEPILFMNDDYYFDANELSRILNMSVESSSSDTVIISYKGTKSTYTLPSRQLTAKNPSVDHRSPETIDSKLYFPFSFLKSTYNVIIKFNQDRQIIYIYSRNSATITDFVNLTFDYSLNANSNYKVNATESENKFEDSAISFTHKDGRISAVVTCDQLDKDSMNNMRRYLNDFSSKDEAIFNKFVEYKMSYFSAMQDYYQRDFLYGISSTQSDELNMKVISQYKENVFSQESEIALYNVIKSDHLASKEETHLNIAIPLASNRTVYSINFSLPKGELDASNIKEINNFIKNLRISNLPKQENYLKVFYDSKSIYGANNGIYPLLDQQAEPAFSTLSNPDEGYEIELPSTFVPYRQNNLILSYGYKSFKIDSNQFFSITSQRISDEKTAIKERINFIKELHKGKISDIEEGSEIVSDKLYWYMKYSISDGNTKVFVQDYFVVFNSRLFNLQLNSRTYSPSQNILKAMVRILGSAKFYPSSVSELKLQPPFAKFINKEEGYSILCPNQWKSAETDNKDIQYDSYTIKNSDYSGPIEVVINEGELNTGLPPMDILKFVTGSSAPELKKYFKKYSAPYFNRISQPVAFSYRQENGTLYLYKLVNFLDSSNRGKLCYSVDIVRDRKIYSLFITVSDYMATNGRIFNKSLSSDLNIIAGSFGLENAQEYLLRKNKGETRNKKIVLIEDFLKQSLNRNINIDSIECLDSKQNLLVSADTGNDAMIYWIKADYDKKEFIIQESMNKKEILKSISEGLKQIYSDKTIDEIKPDERTMSIEVKFHDAGQLSSTTRNFQITGYLRNNSIQWKLDRKNYSSAIKNDCKEYIEKLLGTKARVYFDPEQDFNEYGKAKEKSQPYYVTVYTQFGELSGYFVLKVAPYNDAISLDSYVPIEVIHDKINKLYSIPSTDFILYNIGMSESNKFEFQVFLTSKYSISYKISKAKVILNQETHRIEIK
ncbi:MAG: hypothetical protein N2484_09675 [Clostridia bacterium]|nr:hypothetical protein [Clostridia bacterium]